MPASELPVSIITSTDTEAYSSAASNAPVKVSPALRASVVELFVEIIPLELSSSIMKS